MQFDHSCRSPEHASSRREFLGRVLAGGAIAAGASSMLPTALAGELQSSGKKILNIFLHGGVSQLESWDPKPNTDTGGPFRAIATSVPGIHICELLPHTAKVMHHLTLLRSLNTRNEDHGKGQVEMCTGRNKVPGVDYPHLGAVAAKVLAPESFPLPGHLLIRGGGSGSNPSAYLGPKFASVELAEGKAPSRIERPPALSVDADTRRQQFRAAASDRFSARRRTADTDAYTSSYDQAQQLQAQKEVFDVSKEPASELERYGNSEFGRHCLLARRLLEKGVPFVQVNHSEYDSHHENFDFHIEQLGEFDLPFATLIKDLADRGLLKDTVVCVMSEFGRTPKINRTYGRDHWGKAWSVCLAGGRIPAGTVLGKTNDNGTAVVDHEVDHGHLFHTLLAAAGVDSKREFDIGGRKFPLADPAKSPIKELLG